MEQNVNRDGRIKSQGTACCMNFLMHAYKHVPAWRKNLDMPNKSENKATPTRPNAIRIF